MKKKNRKLTQGNNRSFAQLFQRPSRKGFVTNHEKLLRGRVPIGKRIKRLFSKWRNPVTKQYSPPKENKITKRKVYISCLLIFLFLVFVGFRGAIKKRLTELPLFLLTNIKVTGCLKTTPDIIRERTGTKYNSSLFAVEPGIVRKQLESHPWVYRADVTRRLPDTLVIVVQEYMPKAIIRLGDEEKLYYVDQAGTPFVEVEAGQDMDFPVISGLEGLQSDENLQVFLLNIMSFIEKTDEDDPNLPAQSVSQLHVDSTQGTILFLVDFPFPIFLGKDNIQKKYNRLKKVVGFLYKERRKGLNVSNIAYIRMDYSGKKVLVAHTAQVDQK